MRTTYFVVCLVIGTIISAVIGWRTENWFWFWLLEFVSLIISGFVGVLRWYYCRYGRYELDLREDDSD